MKRILITGATLVATLVGVGAFAIAAPFSPVKDVASGPTPNVAAQYGTPTAPVPPKPGQVTAPAAATKYAAIVRTGTVPITLQVKDKGVKVVGKLTVTAKVAKALGLRVPRGAKFVQIGTATATSTKAGKVVLKVKLTGPAKAAIKKQGNKNTKKPVKSIATKLDLALTKDKKTSKVSKAFTFKK